MLVVVCAYSSCHSMCTSSNSICDGLAENVFNSNNLFKLQRKLMNQLTSPTAAATYEPLQDLESTHLMQDLIQAPAQFWEHLTRYAGSTIMGITFNKRAKLATDADITEVRSPICVGHVSGLTPIDRCKKSSSMSRK